jgi:UDP-glucose 4-epimerase
MKLLLTGGTGYIGSHSAVVLSQAGHDVVLLDNLSNSKLSVLSRLQTILGKTLPFVLADVRDSETVKQALNDHGIQAVVHFAGLKAVGESVAQPLHYFANNVQGTVSLLQAMQAAQVHQLVFSSSATVYGEPQYLPLDEQHPTSATNPYGRTKLHIEEMLHDLAASNSAWRIACLRYFNPVGAHESGLIGEDPNGIPNNLMPFVAQVAAGWRPALQVFGNDYDTPDGTGVRDYIHVMDLAQGHLAALNFLQHQQGWHAINLGTGQGFSVLQMVKAFEAASGQPVPYNLVPRRPGDVASCYAEVDKAKALLDWQATRGLSDMCNDAWRAQQTAVKPSH